ncbi:unnamed protein product [Paramecium pentaurelia]|uniref:EML-like second beta-propeller domain-containing protein n=1 Tax=Paramecium pentaurelia TaxID=43138 RepID=A0A8S1XTD8_9CILI|nr:unnamed protein product [Paramecium pentaurelia]
MVETPQMMEILVQVLPEMMVKATQIVNLKQNFFKNFSKMIKEYFTSQFMIHMYKWQQNKQLKNKIEIELQLDTFVNQDENSEVTQIDIQNLEKIDYHQVSLEVWNKMENNQIPLQLQISYDFGELDLNLLKIIEPNLLLPNTLFNKVKIQKERIIQVVSDALKEYNLTSYDFYSEFIKYYHLKQIEKQQNLGKSINIDSFLHDLKQYSIKLAKSMSNKQVTQVQYKQKGLLYKEEGEEGKWLNEFFNDDTQYGSYKKDIRSCSLIQKKGANFLFVHKSIQDFLIAADLYEMLALSTDLDLQILSSIIERLSKEQTQNQDYLEFISNLNLSELNFKFDTLSLFERQHQLNDIQKNIKLLLNLIRILKQHDFNQINYSTNFYTETRRYLRQKISKELVIIEFLKLIVNLTKIDKNFIQCGSNSLNLLVEMKVDLTKQCFSNIKIKNTSIIGANFAKCNLSGSELENVNINGINLNCAQLFNCKWKHLKIYEVHQFNGHNDTVCSVSFSPDGTKLASGSDDISICLWDVKTGKLKAKLEGHTNWVQSVCFSPDGTTLASGSQDQSIRLWDIETGEQKAKLDGHTHYVYSICFSPDGTTLASGSFDNTIRLWEFKTGKQKAILQCNSQVNSVSISPNGTTLASGSADNSIFFWDVKTGQLKSKLNGHTNQVRSVCFSPDGISLSSGSDDKSIRLWDVKTGQQIVKLDGHINQVKTVCFSLDGTKLASGSTDNSIRLWDVMTGQQKFQLEGHDGIVCSVCFSPDGTILASGSDDQSIRLWDVKTGQQKASFDGHTHNVRSVCFSPDGTTLASGSRDKSIRLWDVKTGQQKAKLDGHINWVQSVCYSPDGATLASGCVDNSIRLWDVNTRETKVRLEGHQGYLNLVSFSPDGTILASCSSFDSIGLWDVGTGQQIAKLGGHTYCVQSLCFSPDGTTLAYGSEDKSIRLKDVKTGQQQFKLDGHSDYVRSVCFSPDGTTLASGSVDNSIRLWDVKTGQQKANLMGHLNDVNTVSFSPDGTTLASGSDDNSIRIWDVKTVKEVKTTDMIQKEILNNLLPEGSIYNLNLASSHSTILLISKQPIFQANGALILKGQFENQSSIDLKTLFKQKGSCILERQQQQIQKLN